jgi:hypothetical protein
MQLRIRLTVVSYYVVGIALLWYVRVHSCRSYFYTWYGLLPLQVRSLSHTHCFVLYAGMTDKQAVLTGGGGAVFQDLGLLLARTVQ